MAVEIKHPAPTISIRTVILAPGMTPSVYLTSAEVESEHQVNKFQLINLMEGHLSLLDAELQTLKDSK